MTTAAAPKLLFEPPIKKWSFSAIKKLEKCPYSLYLQRVERIATPAPREDSPLVRGEKIHKEAELFVKGEGPFTENLKKAKTQLEEARAAYDAGETLELEQQWGVDRAWAPVTWNDPTCWGMIKADLVWHKPGGQTVEVWDHKTGKRFGNEITHTQQMQFYAVPTFMRYANVDLVVAKLVYLDEGKVFPIHYTRPQAMELMPRISARAEKLTSCTDFPPKPNRSNCKWCDYGATNGTGACPYAVVD